MPNTALSLKLREMQRAKKDLEEAIKLVEKTRDLFQKNLAILKEAVGKKQDEKKQKEIILESERLYQEYKKSLQAIEAYMDKTYQNLNN